jgi:hypothetical protein
MKEQINICDEPIKCTATLDLREAIIDTIQKPRIKRINSGKIEYANVDGNDIDSINEYITQKRVFLTKILFNTWVVASNIWDLIELIEIFNGFITNNIIDNKKYSSKCFSEYYTNLDKDKNKVLVFFISNETKKTTFRFDKLESKIMKTKLERVLKIIHTNIGEELVPEED